MTGRTRLPNRRQHETFGFEHGGFAYLAGLGRFHDGRLAELFLSVAKSGTTIEAWAHDAAILASIALQFGAPVETIRHALGRDATGHAATAIGEVFDCEVKQ